MQLLIKIIPFLLFIGLFLFGGHFFLHFSLIKFWHITTSSSKYVLFFVLLFLSLSFILTTILSKLSDNVISRLLYALAGYWLGLFIYLIAASILLWLVYFVGLNQHFLLISFLVYLCVFLFSLSCVYNAFNPVIKNVDIKIKNLPVSWQNKKVVLISDLHLGLVHQPSFLKKVVDQIAAQEPEAIFITGDLFDGMDGDLMPFVRELKQLKAVQGVYFVYGNHEEYLGIHEAEKIMKQADNITVLNNEAVDINGLQIIGIGYGNNQEIINKKDNLPTILLQHTPTDVAVNETDLASKQIKAYWSPDVIFDNAKELGIDLQLSGHTHAGQMQPFGWLTRYIFKGFDYGLKKYGDFQIYTTAGVGTWGPPMRTAKSEIVLINLLNN